MQHDIEGRFDLIAYHSEDKQETDQCCCKMNERKQKHVQRIILKKSGNSRQIIRDKEHFKG